MSSAAPNIPDSKPLVVIDRLAKSIRICVAGVFGPEDQAARDVFLRRVFSVDAVASVTIDSLPNTATIRLTSASRDGFEGVARAMRGKASEIPEVALPTLRQSHHVTISRIGKSLTTWQVITGHSGRVRLRHCAIGRAHVVARRVEKILERLPGVSDTCIESWTNSLLISYRPHRVDLETIVKFAETALVPPPVLSAVVPASAPIRFGMANMTLGVSALTDLAVPALIPLSTLLLLGTNLKTLRDASSQIRHKNLGLPVLYSTIILGTLATGQFLASAVMGWMLRYWRKRHQDEMSAERQMMLEIFARLPTHVRLTLESGEEWQVPLEHVRRGDRLQVRAGEMISADGCVVSGEGVIDERGVRGLDGVARKRVGDKVFAGSTVLFGRLDINARLLGEKTRVAAITRAFLEATAPKSRFEPPASEKRHELALRAIGPTLATAGVGLMFGGLGTALAVLRPDYSTGPSVCNSLDDLGDIARCLQLGIVVRDPLALERLSHVDLMILADVASDQTRRVRLVGVESQSLKPDELLRLGGSLGRFLPGERGLALTRACRERSIALLDVLPTEWNRGVVASSGNHRIRLLEVDARPEEGSIVILVDDKHVGTMHFRTETVAEQSATIDELRALGRFQVVQSLGQTKASPDGLLAGEQLVDFSDKEFVRLFKTLSDRGIRFAFVGDSRRHSAAIEAAYVGIAIVTDGQFENCSAPVLISEPHSSQLSELIGIATSRDVKASDARINTLIPNLACVVGAFFLGFTSLTAVVVSNLGTFGNINRARRNLHRSDRLATGWQLPLFEISRGVTNGLDQTA